MRYLILDLLSLLLGLFLYVFLQKDFTLVKVWAGCEAAERLNQCLCTH
jgi:hypothetical protein